MATATAVTFKRDIRRAERLALRKKYALAGDMAYIMRWYRWCRQAKAKADEESFRSWDRRHEKRLCYDEERLLRLGAWADAHRFITTHIRLSFMVNGKPSDMPLLIKVNGVYVHLAEIKDADREVIATGLKNEAIKMLSRWSKFGRSAGEIVSALRDAVKNVFGEDL